MDVARAAAHRNETLIERRVRTAAEPLVQSLQRKERNNLSSYLWMQKGSEWRKTVSRDTRLVPAHLTQSRGFRRRYFCRALQRDKAINNEVSGGTCGRCFHLSLRSSPVIFFFVYLTAKAQQTGIYQSACILVSRRGNKGRVEIPACH